MDENDFLERLQEQFGFIDFVIVGVTPAAEGGKELNDLHLISGMSSYGMLLMLNEAMASLIDDLADESPAVH